MFFSFFCFFQFPPLLLRLLEKYLPTAFLLLLILAIFNWWIWLVLFMVIYLKSLFH